MVVSTFESTPGSVTRPRIPVPVIATCAMGALFPIACALPRLCAAALYLRIFAQTNSSRYNKYARMITYGLIVIMVGSALAFSIPMAVEVPPLMLEETGPPVEYHAHWVNPQPTAVWIGIPHVVTDLVMLALPLPLIWRLHSDMWKKLGLMVVFLAGGL